MQLLTVVISTVLVAVLVLAQPTPIPVSLWPAPQSMTTGTSTLTIDGDQFRFRYEGQSDLMREAIERYRELIFTHRMTLNSAVTDDITVLPELHIRVISNDETLQYGVDESYSLTIPGDGTRSELEAQTVYGALRGLETFSQLIRFHFEAHAYELPNAPIAINDAPRFSHRGLLVDTARHFEPLRTLRTAIDSMSYTKLNVLHWHVVDSQSFPFESTTYPNLWAGAYSEDEMFTQRDVADLVEYARRRGVRVMIEFDIPGHAASWCTGYPEICPSPTCKQPLDPSSNLTWSVIDGLMSEVTGSNGQAHALFPDNFVHLGGDEVNTNCWTSTPHVAQWLAQNNLTTEQAYMLFVERGHQAVIPAGRSPVNWEEVFNHFGTNLDKQTIVHIWLDHATLAKVVAAGYRALLSNSDVWYLDHLSITWQQFYLNDPFQGITDPKQQQLVLGGELCMWGETVDTSDMMQTVWPRAAAGAERLWSAAVKNDTTEALPRLERFRCLLNHRGIAAAPTNNADARSAPPSPGSCYVQ